MENQTPETEQIENGQEETAAGDTNIEEPTAEDSAEDLNSEETLIDDQEPQKEEPEPISPIQQAVIDFEAHLIGVGAPKTRARSAMRELIGVKADTLRQHLTGKKYMADTTAEKLFAYAHKPENPCTCWEVFAEVLPKPTGQEAVPGFKPGSIQGGKNTGGSTGKYRANTELRPRLAVKPLQNFKEPNEVNTVRKFVQSKAFTVTATVSACLGLIFAGLVIGGAPWGALFTGFTWDIFVDTVIDIGTGLVAGFVVCTVPIGLAWYIFFKRSPYMYRLVRKVGLYPKFEQYFYDDTEAEFPAEAHKFVEGEVLPTIVDNRNADKEDDRYIPLQLDVQQANETAGRDLQSDVDTMINESATIDLLSPTAMFPRVFTAPQRLIESMLHRTKRLVDDPGFQAVCPGAFRGSWLSFMLAGHLGADWIGQQIGLGDAPTMPTQGTPTNGGTNTSP